MQRNYDGMRQSDSAAREARAESQSALDRDLFDKREHQRRAAMFTSLRITRGRLGRELRAVPDTVRSAGRRLSEMLCYGTVTAPGVYDGLTIRAAAAAGFRAAYVSGAALSATALGRPDLGYLGLAEMAEQVRRMTAVSDLPLIVDADTGYGGILQVEETRARFEAAGAAAVQFEDQVAPKRCGHLAGTQLFEGRPSQRWASLIGTPNPGKPWVRGMARPVQYLDTRVVLAETATAEPEQRRATVGEFTLAIGDGDSAVVTAPPALKSSSSPVPALWKN